MSSYALLSIPLDVELPVMNAGFGSVSGGVHAREFRF
jgi:hypothetical protein